MSAQKETVSHANIENEKLILFLSGQLIVIISDQDILECHIMFVFFTKIKMNIFFLLLL
jgi:hypothetical protein